jgi:hypothetical protein
MDHCENLEDYIVKFCFWFVWPAFYFTDDWIQYVGNAGV